MRHTVPRRFKMEPKQCDKCGAPGPMEYTLGQLRVDTPGHSADVDVAVPLWRCGKCGHVHIHERPYQ